jgi:hypothetical protein
MLWYGKSKPSTNNDKRVGGWDQQGGVTMSELKPCPFCGGNLEYKPAMDYWCHPDNECILACIDSEWGTIGVPNLPEYVNAWNSRTGNESADIIKQFVEMLRARVSGVGVHSAIDCVATEMGVDV